MNTGWICPRCNTSNAPFVRECKCSKKSKAKDIIYAISKKTLVDRDAIDVKLITNDLIVLVEDEKQYYKLNTSGSWTHYTPGSNVVLINK